MENEHQNPESLPEPDLFQREEKCVNAIRVVRKALFMRLLMAVLMVWVAAIQSPEPIVWSVAAFVLLVIGLGALPLIAEWKKQRAILKDLIAQEEE